MFNGRDQNPRGPANLNGYLAAQPDNMGAGRVRIEHARRYLEQVKQQLADNPQTYITFLDVMRDFKSHQLDTYGVISRVSQLFNEFPQLIMGFNAFLPPGFNIQVIQNEIIVVEHGNPIQYVLPRQPYNGRFHEDGEDEMEDGNEEEREEDDEEAEVQRLGGEKVEGDGEVQEEPEEPEGDEEKMGEGDEEE